MSNISPKVDSVERITRFQSLQSGEYWRAKIAIDEEGIIFGDVLLVESIRWVDNVAHTIILRSHPRHYGEYATINYVEANGEEKRTHKKMLEHRFLVKDFLNLFDHEPDFQRIRAKEIQDVQDRVNHLQLEMSNVVSTPHLMLTIVEEQLKKDEEKTRRESGEQQTSSTLPALYNADVIVPLVVGTVQNAISHGVTDEGIEAMKDAAHREHRIATIKSEWIQSQTNQIAATVRAMTPFYQEMAAAALAQTEDVRSHVDKLLAGIKTLDLYVGKNVEIITINKGESANPSIPLTFVQRKLMMNEELAVWADIDDWFDFENQEMFFEALRNHPGLVDQVFPTERCILVMACTRHNIDYGDPWANNARNRENKRVFLMARDGQNFYQIFSPVESHLGSSHLFPTTDEQKNIFRGLDGSQIKFEDVAYTDKLKIHELMSLHYKRFLILVCGLDHREKLFGDFYDEPQSMNFISLRFQEEYCRFLHDVDGTGLLPTEDRISLSDYIKSKNSYLRSGSRVLCNWYSLMTPDTAPGACKVDNHSKYRSAYFQANPKDKISMSIAYKQGESLCVDVPVQREFSGSHFNCKVDVTKHSGSWRESHDELPYLCLDAIDPDELEWYIMNRKYRLGHLFYIRFFKMAVKYLRNEQVYEKSTRKRMEDALIAGGIGEPDEHQNIIKQAVIAWRSAQRGEPLTTALESEKAWQSLLDQMYQLAGAGENQIDDIDKFVTKMGYQPLRLVVNAKGKLTIYASPTPQECDNRLEDHPWVHRINVVRGKRKIRELTRTWSLLPASVASESTIHQWEDAKKWSGLSSIFSSYNSKQKIFSVFDLTPEKLALFSKPMEIDTYIRVFNEWVQAYSSTNLRGSTVHTPSLLIPFAIRLNKNGYSYLHIGTRHTERLLYQLAPTDAYRNKVVMAYSGMFKNQVENAKRLIQAASEPVKFQLFENGDVKFSCDELFTTKPSYAYFLLGNMSGNSIPAKVKDKFAIWLSNIDSLTTFFIPDNVKDDNGDLILDDMLNIKNPDDYAPVEVVDVNLGGNRFSNPSTYIETGEPVKYGSWLDICECGTSIETLISGINAINVQAKRLTFDNKTQAENYIKGKSYYYKNASEVDNVPPAPNGVERWVN